MTLTVKSTTKSSTTGSASGLDTGAEGAEVELLQHRLTDAGFSTHGTDGKFGPNTASAVRRFQAANHLPQTGSVDAATAAAIESAPTTLQRQRTTDGFQTTTPTTGTVNNGHAGESVNAHELSITRRLAARSDLQPRGGVTHCNEFARAYATQMLGDTAQTRSLFAGNAHQQYQQLAAAARSGHGVREITAAEAGRLGAEGKCVMVATSTLSSGGHGHIAAVIGTGADGQPRTGQAGSTNYGDGPLSTRFTGRVAGSAHYYVIG